LDSPKAIRLYISVANSKTETRRHDSLSSFPNCSWAWPPFISYFNATHDPGQNDPASLQSIQHPHPQHSSPSQFTHLTVSCTWSPCIHSCPLRLIQCNLDDLSEMQEWLYHSSAWSPSVISRLPRR
jgi:hypothetical protein